jgi:hypothetical protein
MSDQLSPEEIEDLTTRLAVLESRQQWAPSKPALRAILREAGEIKWRLGLITDGELDELEAFYEDFNFEV